MPELPEVEVVRRGLARWIRGAGIESIQILDPRSVRRHAGGPDDFVRTVTGRRIGDVVRRGKFLWFLLEPAGPHAEPTALLAHLGMSGQVLLQPPTAPDERHLRIRIILDGIGAHADEDGEPGPAPEELEHDELRFVDQRIFGGMWHTGLVPAPDGLPGGLGGRADSPALLPPDVVHIARDPLDPAFDDAGFAAALHARRTGIKRALLDQGLISGIGNIYADEALWIARLHYERPSSGLTRPAVARLLAAVREVMTEALAAGGTSFDSLYVNVNGESGYFARSLKAYGREGEPCHRCGTPVRRAAFMNRSSYFCPQCQRPPRGV